MNRLQNGAKNLSAWVKYVSKSNFIAKKYCRIIEKFAKKQGISLDAALKFFYHSDVYQLLHDGVSDMHCMADEYLVEELSLEYSEG